MYIVIDRESLSFSTGKSVRIIYLIYILVFAPSQRQMRTSYYALPPVASLVISQGYHGSIQVAAKTAKNMHEILGKGQ
jgi:hypothetical protein